MKKLLVSILMFVMICVAVEAIADSNRKITFENDEYILYLGAPQKISVTVERINEEAPKQTKLNWSSSDENVVTVSNGSIKGIAAGKATVTVVAQDDPALSSSVTVEVRVPVKKVAVDPVKGTLLVGASPELATMKMNYFIEPENAFAQDVIWTSSNENIAKIDADGTIHALAKGNVIITATSTDPTGKKKSQANIAIGSAVTDIELAETEVTIPITKTVQLKATVLPQDAMDKKVKWSSSNENVATVNEKGIVQGISVGEAVITAVSSDGTMIEASCKVTVAMPISSISINDNKTVNLPAGYKLTLAASVEPEDATVKTVEWSSSNEKIAIVDDNGVVTGISKGTANIFASSVDGSKVKGKATVVVDEYNLVFINPVPQIATYYMRSGHYVVKGSVKNGCVTIPEFGDEVDMIVIGGPYSESFEVTPLKPGIDTITVVAGNTKTQVKVFVSESAVKDVAGDNIGIQKAHIVSEEEKALDQNIENADGSQRDEILFRDVPWGSNYSTVSSAVPSYNGFWNAESKDYGSYIVYNNHTFNDAATMVAGHKASSIISKFYYEVSDEGKIKRGGKLYSGTYRITDDNKSSVSKDIEMKLIEVYGEPDKQEGKNKNKTLVWYGNNHTMLTYNVNKGSITMIYTWLDGEKLRYVADEAYEQEKMDKALKEYERKNTYSDSTDGL